jgi:hypothetical protein
LGQFLDRAVVADPVPDLSLLLPQHPARAKAGRFALAGIDMETSAMKVPPFYSVFCLLVLGAFIYAKVEGLALFGASNATASSGGGHGTGVFLGGHK